MLNGRPGYRFTLILTVIGVVAAACSTQANEPTTEPPTTSPPVTAATTTILEPTTTSSTTVTTISSTTSTSVHVSDDPKPLDSVVGGTPRGEGWLVEPGTYTSQLGAHAYTFRITEPVVYFPSDVRITFGPPNSIERFDMIVFMNLEGVIPAAEAGHHADHDPVVPEYTVPTPERLDDWVRSVPQLVLGAEQEYAFDGYPARAWDVTVDESTTDTFDCPWGACVSAWVHETEGVYVLFKEGQFRLWQFDGDAQGVYGFLQSRDSSFAATVALAEMLLEDLIIQRTS